MNKFLEYTAGWKTKGLAVLLVAANSWEALAPFIDLGKIFSNPMYLVIFNMAVGYGIWWARNQAEV